MVQAHSAGQFEGIEHGLRIGLLGSDDVIGGAVGWRSDWYWQAAMHRDALLKAHQLHGNLALVVVHGDHAVVAPFLADGAHKGGIGREGSVCWVASGYGQLYTGRNHCDLFIAVVAVVAVVRVEPAHRYAWLRFASGFERI